MADDLNAEFVVKEMLSLFHRARTTGIPIFPTGNSYVIHNDGPHKWGVLFGVPDLWRTFSLDTLSEYYLTGAIAELARWMPRDMPVSTMGGPLALPYVGIDAAREQYLGKSARVVVDYMPVDHRGAPPSVGTASIRDYYNTDYDNLERRLCIEVIRFDIKRME